MSHPYFLSLSLLFLSGCAGPQAGEGSLWPWPWPPASPAAGMPGGQGGGGRPAAMADSGYAHFDFGWRLAGDPEIMPLQVFDDGERMWLQFPSEGAWPAVFEVRPGGRRPLPYRDVGPYMVLEGIFGHLELRGGHLRGSIRREPPAAGAVPDPAVSAAGDAGAAVSPAQTLPIPAVEPPVASTRAGAGPEAPESFPRVAAPADPGPESIPGAGPSATLPRSEPARAALTPPPPSAFPVPPAAVPPGAGEHAERAAGSFFVSPADITMRQALERWAAASGWTFFAEHWAVDVDIPLAGEAYFETDFKSAVRELLAATEMGDRPLQPCFYSNRVVRVVPYAQACDRRGAMGAMS